MSAPGGISVADTALSADDENLLRYNVLGSSKATLEKLKSRIEAKLSSNNDNQTKDDLPENKTELEKLLTVVQKYIDYATKDEEKALGIELEKLQAESIKLREELTNIRSRPTPKEAAARIVTTLKQREEAEKSKPQNSYSYDYPACRMFFPSSGHIGFNILDSNKSIEPIDSLSSEEIELKQKAECDQDNSEVLNCNVDSCNSNICNSNSCDNTSGSSCSIRSIYDEYADSMSLLSDPSLSSELPTLEVLHEMISYESSLRLSFPIQNLMDKYHMNESAVTSLHDHLQQIVVEKYGFKHVNALRTALYRFPNDPIINSVFYIKYNRITQGKYFINKPIQNINLFNIDGQLTTLLDYYKEKSKIIFNQSNISNPPLILIAGSSS